MVQLDVRSLPPRRKHPTIFELLAELKLGETLQITNDHDPRPLRYQLDAEHPDEFSWEYCESEPELWIVAITRVAGPLRVNVT